jgi:hypothetical protein
METIALEDAVSSLGTKGSVIIEKNGQAVATLIALPARTSGRELARRLAQMEPQVEAAEEIRRISHSQE